MRALVCILLLAPLLAAEDESEETALRAALQEAGSSPVDFIRTLENHLDRFPKSGKRSELERALAKAAIESKDRERTIRYGERVLERDQDDLQILERVSRALLDTDDRPAAERALKYAKRYFEIVHGMKLQDTPGRVSSAEWQQELDRGVSRAFALQARATGNLGKSEEAVKLARSAFDAYPTAEASREIARWLIRQGKEMEAVAYLADAFTLTDPKNGETDRLRDRQRMGALYSKVKGGEQGLGDLILQSYDRTTAMLDGRRQRILAADPNAKASEVLDFTLSGLNKDVLKLRTLEGKVVVFDFWATWCGPCRIQHPLYAQVKEKYKLRDDVVFVSVNTDEDRSIVAPFLRDNDWKIPVYFEDGLSRTLQISSIPTTVILDKRGKIFSRMNGFLPDRFVEMLADRIEGAIKGL
ncbi:MAG: thioredoxin-like domain-containing protein [Bryobacteraceae bacterium]